MPIYEYICQDCRQIFESLRTMKEADLPIVCTHCRGEKTTRMLSLFNAQSGGHTLSGSSAAGCSGCTAGSCAGCRH